MEKYIALIRKDDFVDLFKYGSFHINKDSIRKFTCPVSELPQKESIFNDLVYFSNAFDSTFEYVFIIFRKGQNRDNDLNISDVLGIYPLDQEAKRALSLNLDPRIVINDPLWPDAVFPLQKKHTLNDFKAGIANVWKIYGLKDSIESVKNYIPDEVFNEFIDEMYENRRPKGDIPLLTYIMRYNRHAFYPKNTVGYFMDTINAVFSYMQKREVDSSEIMGTMIMQFLQHCSDTLADKSFGNIFSKLYKEPSVSKILEKINEFEPNYNLLKAATLYYIFRDRYREELKYEEIYLKTGLKNGFEFSVACYLLGATLGHDHTYDCLYSELPLPIFTKYDYDQEEVVKKNEEKVEDVKDADAKEKENVKTPKTTSIQHPEANPQTGEIASPVKDQPSVTSPQEETPISEKENKQEGDKSVGRGDSSSNSSPLTSPEDIHKVPQTHQPQLFPEEGTPLEEPILLRRKKGSKITQEVSTQEHLKELLDQGWIVVDNKSKKKSKKIK